MNNAIHKKNTKKSKIRILMVEDSPDDATLIIIELRRGGFQSDYTRVDKIAELKTALATQKWDLIIADFSLPGFNALESLSIIRSHSRYLPVIVVSGVVNEEMAVNVMRAGAQDFIPKENLSRLIPAVEREMQDVLRRNQQILTEEILRQFAMVIEQTHEIVVITDTNGTIQYVNPTFEKVTGYSYREAIGQNPRILKSGKHNEKLYQQMWETISQGKKWSGRLINKRKDGSLFTEETSIIPLMNEEGELDSYVAVKRDITGQLELEEQLHQAQKMESIGRLTGGIAHDFKNLLTPILGYSQMLLHYGSLNDETKGQIEQINIAAISANNLIEQLLAFSRKQILKKESVSLNEIIGSMQGILQQTLGDDIELKIDLSHDVSDICSDKTQIERVIMNLTTNAREGHAKWWTCHYHRTEYLSLRTKRKQSIRYSPWRICCAYIYGQREWYGRINIEKDIRTLFYKQR